MTTTDQPPFLITGATSGLGRQVALELGRRGCSLILGGRREEVLLNLCDTVERETPGRALPFLADLSDLDAVNAAIESLPATALAGIVTNAGVSPLADVRSAQGYELTFAVNVLAHQLILARLGGRVSDGGRIICLSSGTHDPDNRLARFFRIPIPVWVGTLGQARPETLAEDARLPLGPIRYSTSKLGNVLQARGLQARLRDAGRDIDVFAMDPGLMVDTDLARDAPAPLRWMLRGIGRLATPFVENMRLASTTRNYVANILLEPEWSGKGFSYVDGDAVRPPSPDAMRDELVEELWRESLPLIGLTPESLQWVS